MKVTKAMMPALVNGSLSCRADNDSVSRKLVILKDPSILILDVSTSALDLGLEV